MTTLMSIPFSSRSGTVARAQSPASSLSLSAALGEQLSTLYGLAERSAPGDWRPEFYCEAVVSILKRFIIRCRSLLAYGQHL